MSCKTPQEYTKLVTEKEVKEFCVRCMRKVGASSKNAEELADVLVEGDKRGHYSHGLNRLEMYVDDISKGICAIRGEPVITKESVSTALVDGKNLLGPVVGNFAMNIAIEKARETGISLVTAHGSNHYGIAGWYSLKALQHGLIGLSFTNTSPLVFPTNGKKLAVGTNPITLAAPATNSEDHFVLDMATSAVALGKLEMNRRRGLSIPKGWGADETGMSTDDATIAITKGGLLPLGGDEETSGYKGYGLGMLVEILCGILSGSSYGGNIRRWMNTTTEANLGQAFMAIDPNAFAPGFSERLTDYVRTMRDIPRTDEDMPVLVPGDPERAHLAECTELGAIRYPPVLLNSLEKLAERLDIPKLQILKDL